MTSADHPPPHTVQPSPVGGALKATLVDTSGEWRRSWSSAGLGDGGAVLVRPDGHVGWVHTGRMATDDESEVALENTAALPAVLQGALEAVLGGKGRVAGL